MAKCNECNEEILGRVDKRFCSTYCRSSWHNKKYQSDHTTIRKVNTILKKNRRILHEVLNSKNNFITTQHLLEHGFNFGYYTSIDTLRNNAECKFCYEIGYYKNAKNTFKIKLKNKKR